ncbi:RNA polymerase sigma factor [Cellulosilyticum lentocellum]|uniref:RNA polymerase, sigma-24 subunit, ECF subfamily n=1 Tax=Cellulosilyticum lentocellum (strain ATCC 49066 / DSM 5427 / NCIMB 11756 / RHM5) TaxID=642492 RepID=F2JL82_CELLD|nr:RNA polymerase sigma factor [Cellulosilyticum lentocellum]ADZ85727.1 RNA polymerase, sigma-24 subunit, ECF subfamily [Cellulosilyticum lentocellum DSM 5427]
MSIEIQDQYDKIYRYCYFKVKNKEVAEDLTQEAFLKYFAQTSYINRGKPLAYLYTIAKHLTIDYFEQLEKQLVYEDVPTEEGIYQFETNIIFQEVVETLPKELQELLLLRFTNELGMSEISNILGISRFALYRKLHLAMDKLRAVLRKEDFYE